MGVHHHKQSAIQVYRGQCLSKNDFDNMQRRKGGFITFNNLLSAAPNREICSFYAHSVAEKPETVGVVFVINADPNISSIPFALISDISNFPVEEEVLFSRNSVFRIGDIKPNYEDNCLYYEINLTLTDDQDSESHILEQHIRQEITGQTDWDSLTNLLFKAGQYRIVEELCKKHLKKVTDESKQSLLYYQLGLVLNEMGEYSEALSYHEKALDIQEESLPSNHSDLARSYNDIGLVYNNMGEYATALRCHEKALDIRKKSLPPNHPDLARSYNDIGLVYNNMGDYSKALQYHEKALEIRKKSLPSNHPDLARSYNNIGLVYNKMKDYSKALSFLERAVNIGQSSLPAEHPDLQVWKKSLEQVKALQDH